MIIYPAVFIISTLFAMWGERQAYVRDGDASLPRKITLGAILVTVVLAGVSALRWRVGTDYWTYEHLFAGYVEDLPQNFTLTGEPGLPFLAWLVAQTGADSVGMFALASVITIGLIVNTIWRWSRPFAFTIALLIVSGVWHGSFNAVRQYLACAILVAGHRHIINREPIRWTLIVLIAALFHMSAIAAILMYFVPTRRTSFPLQLAVFALGAVGAFGFTAVIDIIAAVSGDGALTESEYVYEAVDPLRIGFALVPIALYWLLKNRKAIDDTGAWFYVNMSAAYASVFIAAVDSAYIARFAIYAAPFMVMGLAPITEVPDRNERVLIRSALVCLFAAFMFVEVSGVENLSNFRWIFERD